MEGRDRDFDTAPLVSALNLILQKYATTNGVRVGQNKYFFPSEEQFPLSLGLDACRGFFMSVRPSFKQLTVNINACMTAFYTPGNLAQAMFAFQREVGAFPAEFFEKLKVVTTHLGYPKKKAIICIMGTSPRKTQFKCDEYGGQITVENYFKRSEYGLYVSSYICTKIYPEYGITLQHADSLPVVNLGTKDKPNFTPPEICEIPHGQAFRGTLPDTATAEMIKVACNPTAFNANLIVNKGFAQLGLQGNNELLGNFGVSVSNEMITTPSRELPAPKVTYRSGQPSVRDGAWNILGVKFHEGGNMTNWAVLLVQEGRRSEFQNPGDPQLTAFLKVFVEKCRSSGMTVGAGPPTIMQTPRLPRPNDDSGRRQALATIRQTFEDRLNPNKKPSFVLVLLSGVDKFIYPGLKRMCDMQLGLSTVCMLLDKARRDKGQDQYFSNVALKVNVKLGGVNHMLAPESMRWLLTKKTMLVGIDVTHPSPTSMKGTPSIAAVVASVDDRFVHFPAALQIQRNRNIDKDAEEVSKRYYCHRYAT